jgi:glycosyltransferase involved in cell wall biosynthesis
MSTHVLPRVVFVLEKPVQHFAESFRFAARSHRYQVSVIYWIDNKGGRFDQGFGRHVSWDADLVSGYSWQEATGSIGLTKAASFALLLQALHPNIIVCFGWATVIARLGIIWSVLSGTPFLLFGDSTWQHSENPGRRWLRKPVLRTVFRLAAGALSTGTFNREFYIHLGMRPSRVFDSVYPIDVEPYAQARGQRLVKNTGPTIIGFAGKLIPRKGVDELVRALGHLSRNQNWQARIIGEGQERQRLEALSQSLGIGDRVEFAGFRNTSEMPAELASCDIVVVPSRFDLRVVVAAEAMATGAAVVVSSKTAVWGRGDLIEDGVSGRVYLSGDASELAKILEELIKDPVARAALQREGARRASGQGPEAFSRGLEQALTALDWRRRRRNASHSHSRPR